MSRENADAVRSTPVFPGMDSLRAIAMFTIFALHAAVTFGVPGSAWYSPYVFRVGFGLSLFFVMSAFLLYRPFVAVRYRGAPFPSIRQYARGRFLRIFPAYWLALTVFTIFLGAYGVRSDHFWFYYLALQEYGPGVWTVGGIPQAWVVSVLVSFYILLPLLAWCTSRLFLPGEGRLAAFRGELILIGGLYLMSVVYRLTVTGGETPESVIGWLTPTVVVPGVAVTYLPGIFDWLALGMGLAVVSVALEGRERRPWAVGLIERVPSICWLAALVLYVVACEGLFPQFPQPLSPFEWFAGQAIYGFIALLLLLPLVIRDGEGGLPHRILANPVLIWLGALSYGLYLYHGLILSELGERNLGPLSDAPGIVLTAIGFLITVACAAVSYYGLERPLLRRNRRRQSGLSRGEGALARDRE